VYHHTNFLTSK